MDSVDPVYARYWQRKRLRGACPHFPVIGCGARFDGDVLRTVSAAIAGADSLLDIGAGDLTMRGILRGAGFSGRYATLDVGGEYVHDYASLEQVTETFDAVLLMDVIEHLPLSMGLGMLNRAARLLNSGGVLVVQTPNGRCVRSPFTSDMTHVQAYNLPDLWAELTAIGLEANGYRVAFSRGSALPERLRALPARWFITHVLGLDYADNILLVARKSSGTTGSRA